MSLKQRRILYILFIASFFIITPAISFYAAGYNFDFNSGEVQRTGILILKTDPKDASVNLGENKKFNWLYDFFYKGEELRTPQKLRNLLADKYEITLTKDGYFDYQRDVEINSGETIVLDNILLFKNSWPENITDENIIKTKLSPDKNKLAMVSVNELIILNLIDSSINKISLNNNFSTQDFDILWAPSNKRLVLTFGNFPVFNIESKRQETAIKEYIVGDIKEVVWDDFSDSEVYVRKNSGIYFFDLISKNKELVLNKKTEQFLVKDNNIYIIEKVDNDNYLNIYHDNKIIKSISVPVTSVYEFINLNSSFIYLHDQRHDILYTIDPWSIFPIKDSINGVKNFSLINEDKILYWNDYEIWQYNKNNQDKMLVTRVSEKINKALWHPSQYYIIYNTNSSVNTIELEDNKYLDSNKILDWTDTNDMIMAQDGKELYFLSWMDDMRILYSLEIK